MFLKYLKVDMRKQEHWYSVKAKAIAKEIQDHGLEVRKATGKDIGTIRELVDGAFGPHIANQTTTYIIHRAVSYSQQSLLVYDGEKPIAVKLAVGYSGDPSISQSLLAVVKKKYSGLGLGTSISRLSCLLAIEEGCVLRKATAHYKNYPSIYNLLNKVGYTVDTFEDNYMGFGESRLTLKMELRKEIHWLQECEVKPLISDHFDSLVQIPVERMSSQLISEMNTSGASIIGLSPRKTNTYLATKL